MQVYLLLTHTQDYKYPVLIVRRKHARSPRLNQIELQLGSANYAVRSFCSTLQPTDPGTWAFWLVFWTDCKLAAAVELN